MTINPELRALNLRGGKLERMQNERYFVFKMLVMSHHFLFFCSRPILPLECITTTILFPVFLSSLLMICRVVEIRINLTRKRRMWKNEKRKIREGKIGLKWLYLVNMFEVEWDDEDEERRRRRGRRVGRTTEKSLHISIRRVIPIVTLTSHPSYFIPSFIILSSFFFHFLPSTRTKYALPSLSLCYYFPFSNNPFLSFFSLIIHFNYISSVLILHSLQHYHFIPSSFDTFPSFVWCPLFHKAHPYNSHLVHINFNLIRLGFTLPLIPPSLSLYLTLPAIVTTFFKSFHHFHLPSYSHEDLCLWENVPIGKYLAIHDTSLIFCPDTDTFRVWRKRLLCFAKCRAPWLKVLENNQKKKRGMIEGRDQLFLLLRSSCWSKVGIETEMKKREMDVRIGREWKERVSSSEQIWEKEVSWITRPSSHGFQLRMNAFFICCWASSCCCFSCCFWEKQSIILLWSTNNLVHDQSLLIKPSYFISAPLPTADDRIVPPVNRWKAPLKAGT